MGRCVTLNYELAENRYCYAKILTSFFLFFANTRCLASVCDWTFLAIYFVYSYHRFVDVSIPFDVN